MTPEQAFKMGGRHPRSGLWARQWYAVGTVFFPQGVEDQGKAFLGFRMLTCMDMASHYNMDFRALLKDPEPLTAVELIEFSQSLIDKFGKPSAGFIYSHSCWLSSTELVLDEDTAEQGEFLEQLGFAFGPMPQREKDDLEKWGRDHGFVVVFDANQVC